MKKSRILIMSVLIAGFAMQARAQKGEVQMTASYSVGIPMSDFNNFINNVSPRGWDLSVLYNLNNRISIGAGVAYQDFYKKYPRQLYKTSDGTDISAVLTNSVQITPLLAMARYHLAPGAKVQPYIGVGVGANLVSYTQTLGEYTWDSRNKVKFAAKPEAGVYIPVSKNKLTGISIGAAYNFMPFNYGQIKNLDNLAIHAGISFPLRD